MDKELIMRVEKIELATFASNLIRESGFLFFITYKGLNVVQFSELRDKLYTAEAKCHVLKNSLIRLGVSNAEFDMPAPFDIRGDTAAVFGNGDPCSAAKVIKEFSQESEAVTFKAGLLDGCILDANDTARIADLPSKDMIRSQVLSVLQAPMTNLVRVFNAKTASLVYLLQAYAEKKQKTS